MNDTDLQSGQDADAESLAEEQLSMYVDAFPSMPEIMLPAPASEDTSACLTEPPTALLSQPPFALTVRASLCGKPNRDYSQVSYPQYFPFLKKIIT